MHILLTNDDGITSPGLWAAARALAPLGKIIIVAPNRDYSGYGTAVPPQEEISLTRYQSPEADLRQIEAYAAPATPATCVQIGLSGALTHLAVGLVVSGINGALNLGCDMLSSGAFGAALTANLLGIPAIAVSIDGAGSAKVQWEAAAATLQAVICGQSWDAGAPMLYNINVPNRPLAELKKLQTTSPSGLLSQYHHYVSSASERGVRISRVPDDRPAEMHPGSDAWAVAFGHVSLTPVRFFADVLAPITRGAALPMAALVAERCVAVH